MNNEKLNANLSNLERKLKLLLSEYNAIREEAIALRAENQLLKESVKSTSREIAEFRYDSYRRIYGSLKK